MTPSAFRLDPCLAFNVLFKKKLRFNSRHQGSASAISEPKQEEAFFSPRSLSPGESGTNGNTVETKEQERTKGHSLDGKLSGVELQ